MIRRMFVVALGGLLVGMIPAAADEVTRLEGDRVQRIVKPLAEATAKLPDLPIKVELDGEHAVGLSTGKAGLIVVPDARLTLDRMKKLDRELVPVGMLYLYKMTPIAAEQAVPADQHRTIDLTVEDRNVTVAALQLAASRVEGRLVLLAYTRGKIPALVTELVDTDENKDLPLDLEASKVGPGRGALVVNILGHYRAAISVAAQE